MLKQICINIHIFMSFAPLWYVHLEMIFYPLQSSNLTSSSLLTYLPPSGISKSKFFCFFVYHNSYPNPPPQTLHQLSEKWSLWWNFLEEKHSDNTLEWIPLVMATKNDAFTLLSSCWTRLFPWASFPKAWSYSQCNYFLDDLHKFQVVVWTIFKFLHHHVAIILLNSSLSPLKLQLDQELRYVMSIYISWLILFIWAQ